MIIMLNVKSNLFMCNVCVEEKTSRKNNIIMYPRLQCREPAPKKNQDCIYDYFKNNNNKFGSTNH